MPKTKPCGTCIHFAPPEEGDEFGECRINEPTVIPSYGFDGACGDTVPVAAWPRLRPTDWCSKQQEAPLGRRF